MMGLHPIAEITCARDSHHSRLATGRGLSGVAARMAWRRCEGGMGPGWRSGRWLVGPEGFEPPTKGL